MAINKITSPLSTGPSVFASPVINQLAALLTDCNHGTRVSGGYVKKGSLWNIGGTMFMADSDTAISGTRSASTTGVKFTVSGDAATVSYGTDTVTWDGSQQGYYDTSGNYYYVGSITAGDYPFPAMGVQMNKSTSAGSYTVNYITFLLYLQLSTWSSTDVSIGYYKIPKTGVYRLKRVITVGNSTAGTVSVYCNDVTLGIDTSVSSDTTVSNDLFLEEGDVVNLYIKRTSGNSSIDATISLNIGNYGAIQS